MAIRQRAETLTHEQLSSVFLGEAVCPEYSKLFANIFDVENLLESETGRALAQKARDLFKQVGVAAASPTQLDLF